MASDRQNRRNELARELGYRNDYERRNWQHPDGKYFKDRAESYADWHNSSFEQQYHDKNSGFWQAWRQAAKEGVTVSTHGLWAEPNTYVYGGAFWQFLVDAHYIDPDDNGDSFGDTDSVAQQA